MYVINWLALQAQTPIATQLVLQAAASQNIAVSLDQSVFAYALDPQVSIELESAVMKAHQIHQCQTEILAKY